MCGWVGGGGGCLPWPATGHVVVPVGLEELEELRGCGGNREPPLKAFHGNGRKGC